MNTFHCIGLSRILIKSFESFSKLNAILLIKQSKKKHQFFDDHSSYLMNNMVSKRRDRARLNLSML